MSSSRSGVDFTNNLENNDGLSILDYLYFYNGGGVAIGDINNDGLQDIYFSGNLVKNKLYLNKGDLVFEDISVDASVEGGSTWNTGAVMVDINGDGYLDIYTCAVVGIHGFIGHNELFINNGDLTFTESAREYGLDFESYSSNAVFLDYDLDGDLDMYLLNHAIHTPTSFGDTSLRNLYNSSSGDKFLENDNNHFLDVSERVGIYSSVIGYGLGVAVSDFNNDGYADIYVGNDFHEDDYYYINNGDGTFTDKLREYFGHISKFSMGNDVVDINRDGWQDVLSLDMLPEDEKFLKSTEGDDDIQIQKLRTKNYGYHNQYTRNMLFVSQPPCHYMETALMSGVSATDWSWSALFADFNHDSWQDIFIATGIPKRPNDLDFIKYMSSQNNEVRLKNTKLLDKNALDMMPSGKTQNYLFTGNDDLRFDKRAWMSEDLSISTACAMGDLDNDGDIDLVVNNVNSEASILINSGMPKANYLKIKFDFMEKNRFGIGTKVHIYSGDIFQYKELYTVRGFQASSEPMLHFGLQNKSKIDSMVVIWPDKTYQTIFDVDVNQTLVIKPQDVKAFNYDRLKTKSPILFRAIDNNYGIEFTHKEDSYEDFNYFKTIPYKVSDLGPAVSIGDVDGDGRQDIFFGASRNQPSIICMQMDSTFSCHIDSTLLLDAKDEVSTACLDDFNGDGKNDLIVGQSGRQLNYKFQKLQHKYYLGADGSHENKVLLETFENVSVIKACDWDKDGDLDLFVGGHNVIGEFCKRPQSYLLLNEGEQFSQINEFDSDGLGMVTDALWSDVDGDEDFDLLVVGEWMTPTLFVNEGGQFDNGKKLSENLKGLWQSIEEYDIDSDGDMDYLLGNWGLNTKFKASSNFPLKMYCGDMDDNGMSESIVAIAKEGVYYPLLGLDDLASQLNFLKKKFTAYKDFAGMDIVSVFGKERLNKTTVLEVDELHSGYLKNEKGKFIFYPFGFELQTSPIMTFLKFDFDHNGTIEVLAAGNYFGVTPFHGRFDSFSGAIIFGENDNRSACDFGLNLCQKSVRHLDIVNIQNRPFILVTANNASIELYELLAYANIDL